MGAQLVGVFVDPLPPDVQLTRNLGGAYETMPGRYVLGAQQLGHALGDGIG